MSTVVHFIEFMMVSLVGIMLYRLYSSYLVWKNASVFSSSSLNTAVIPQKGHDLLAGSSEQLSAVSIKILKVKPQTTTTSVNASIEKNSLAKEVHKITRVESKSSTILNDYIGEFFSEPQPTNIEAYRATERKNIVAKSKQEAAAPNNTLLDKVELNGQTSKKQTALHDPLVNTSIVDALSLQEDNSDEVIKVESLFIVPSHSNIDPASIVDADVVTTKASISKVSTVASVTCDSTDMKATPLAEDSIPTLHDFTDVDPESFITVNGEIDDRNKVMSDKVVLAMLNEAKLVCVS